MPSRYPIRAVAKITGISLDTLRAWERRYQAVVPERAGKIRQYGPAHIERLLLLNQLVQRGHAIGGIAGLPDGDLGNLLEQKPKRPVAETETPGDMIAPVLAAIENYDTATASDELNRLAAVLQPRELVYQVAVPMMREVGMRSHTGSLAIAQEHLVSQMLRNLLGSMMRLFRPKTPTIRMIVATPAGESHEFGILASAMLASMGGIEPVYLGTDLPSHEIAEAARRARTPVILLGVTSMNGNMTQEVRSIAESMPESCELWVGGVGTSRLDLTGLGRKTIILHDLAELENECRRWSR